MKINQVSNVHNNNKNAFKANYKQEKKYTTDKQINNLYNNVAYIPFLGGYSLSLKETYSKMPDEQYPSLDIKRDIESILLEGNPLNKTLYDAHFAKYSGINDCYSLDDLKEKYPEFADVKSVYDVSSKKGSFIDKFQNDKLSSFSNDEDLSLQLIKLYWGQGFSLNDLSSHIAEHENKGINLYGTFEKLNIPLMKSKYANVLKLSNKEYNDKITQNLSIRIKEAKEARLQKAQGEPIVIPHGKLSEAHKQHISEGLKKYYSENPDKIFLMSERQKAFYIEHPEKKEEMSEVMLYAWNKTHEGKEILKGINKFFKKQQKKITLEQLSMQQPMDKESKTLLQKFWEVNFWAREKMSSAVKKGYEHVQNANIVKFYGKTIPGEVAVVKIMPDAISKKITDWATHNEIPCYTETLNKAYVILNPKKLIESNDNLKEKIVATQALIAEYQNVSPKDIGLCTEAMLLNLVNLNMQFTHFQPNLPKILRDNPQKRDMAAQILRQQLVKNGLSKFDKNNEIVPDTKFVNGIDMSRIYSGIVTQIAESCGYEFLEYMNKELEHTYATTLRIYKRIND